MTHSTPPSPGARHHGVELAGFHDAHGDPSVVLDPQGVVLLANRAVLDLTGLTEAEIVGRNLGHVIDPAAHAADIEHLRDALAGRPQLYDTRIRSAAGSYRDMRVVVHRLPADDGTIAGLSVVAHDVTEEIAAREALRTSEQRYRSIAEHARVGIYDVTFTDGVGRFAYVNPALVEMSGVPADRWYEDIHVARHHILDDDQQEVGIDAGNRTFVLDRPVRYRWRRPDGEVRWHEAAEVPIRDDEGRLRSVQGIIHDITASVHERELLEDALAQREAAVQNLRHVDRMKSTFLQSVSHEVRTPLTTIVGMSEMLRTRNGALDPAARERIHEAIHRNATRLVDLLSDLLDVDRLSRGILAVRLEPAALHRVTAAVLDGVDLRGRGITSDLGPAHLLADTAKLERIVENLVVNAIEHTPPGCTIHVATRTVGATARLVVEDDGDGVPDEIKDALFQPFVQGPESRVRPSPGTGIGLALVARLAELHGGSVRLEDSEHRGARFVVELPVEGPVDHHTTA